VADWATISALATAGGTLVLAAATFASVRSSNRSARAAERVLLAGIRPVLVPSRFQDPPEKIGFVDDHWLKVEGGQGAAEATDSAVYLAIALRNVGNGLAVLDRWEFSPERLIGESSYRSPDTFRRLTRDLYVPAGDLGFWQGAFREADDPQEFAVASEAIKARQAMTIDLLYGDHEGGQRTITRFVLLPRGEGWLAVASRHWNLDRADPR
jgi:hypothetical protein